MEFKTQWNVKHNIQNRIKALYTELPEPLEVAIAEQAVNEFFACLVLDKTGETITVRKVYDLVGGDNNKVAARLKVLRPYLKAQQTTDDSAIAALKKQIEKQVRARLELELIEQENDYLEQLAALNDAADIEIGQLQQANAVFDGRILAMCSQIEDQKTQLNAYIESEAVRNQSMNALRIKCEKLELIEVGLKDKSKGQVIELENQKQANKNLVDAYSERANVQQSVVEHGQMIQSQLIKEMAGLNEKNKSLEVRLGKAQDDVLVGQKQNAEKDQLINSYNKQTDVSLLISQTLTQALSPAAGFEALAAKLQGMIKLGVSDTSSITRSINSLETQVLNATKDLEAFIEKKLPESSSDSVEEDSISG